MIASALAAWALWAFNDKPGGRFWTHPLDSPTLAWSFNDSWLTNLTALGALLATLLGLTDVLDLVGPKKPDRAVFLLVNFAGLALAAASLIAYQALRGYRLKTTVTAAVPLRIQVRAEPGNGGTRRLTAIVPSVTYAVAADGTLTRAAQLGPPENRTWDNAGHHVAVIPATSSLSNPGGRPAPPPALISLEIPSAGGHAPNAVLLYDATIPELGAVDPGDPKKYLPKTTEESRTKAHGRMIGFVAAGLLASVGVAVQLAATYKILDRAELGDGARQVGFGILIVLVLCAAAYVSTTIVTRVLEVDSTEPKDPPATASLPRQTFGPDAKAPDPIAPAAILNAAGAAEITALDGFDQMTVTSPADLGAITFPTLSYPVGPTSSGDDARPRTTRRETAW